MALHHMKNAFTLPGLSRKSQYLNASTFLFWQLTISLCPLGRARRNKNFGSTVGRYCWLFTQQWTNWKRKFQILMCTRDIKTVWANALSKAAGRKNRLRSKLWLKFYPRKSKECWLLFYMLNAIHSVC